MLEKADSGSDGGRVLIHQPPRRGQHVARRGEDLRRGRVVLRAGEALGAARLALLATVGGARPTVWLPPTVAVLSTGDELVPASRRPGPGQIRESNGAMLAALAARAGAVVRPLGIAPDRAAPLRARIRAGLRADFLLITGGVSVGEFDLVEPALAALGVRTRFDAVAVRPGKPTVFGTRGRTLVFGLPGNPVSAFATFELFVRPAIDRWMGRPARPLRFDATLDAPVGGAGERETYLPAATRLARAGLRARPIPWHGSGDLVGLGGAQALIVVPAHAAPRPAGAAAQVLLLEESLREALAGPAGGARAR
jgi:molybdopterin molybdotransferase